MSFYVVIHGNQPGIYTTAEEAIQAINEYTGSFVKTFSSEKEAKAFFSMNQPSTPESSKHPGQSVDVYVDGSFDKKAQKYSYGAVFLKEQEVIHTMQRSGSNPKYIESHQIAGEVFGALAAIKWAIDHQFSTINLHYDYMGIEMWATKQWRAKKAVSLDYVTYFDKLSPHIEVNFIKVKAHSGEEFNELADQLAKEALLAN